ncbi:MAG TPA: type I-U CRISPR-associated helicase/endonuclease Cas3 [Dokdonella sp.]
MSLEPARFEEFFAALHEGRKPFPWQRRLCDSVMQSGWPRMLALPTASGKTSCIDVALYALAADAPQAPRRILFVVDRRVVVDEAYVHACTIAQRLREAAGGILEEVASGLRRRRGDDPSGDDDPLSCHQLRGGIYRDNAWARTPSQPAVICSTVDQIGSRLLFRGYGVSDFLQPLHAGLVGNDTLILLDEAHCSNPFRQTLEMVARYRSSSGTASSAPFAYALLSATPSSGDGEDVETAFSLDVDDENDDVLGPRLAARKPAHLIELGERTATAPFADRMIEQALSLAEGGAKRIGIIVNRVRGAQLIFERLRVPTERKALFVGRMRPLDRDASMKRWRDVLRSGSTRALDEPVFVVATQCIEVGADLDFDALLSECASLDALRQRFGRLYRLGEPAGSDPLVRPPGVVVIAKDGMKNDDPIYGAALRGTWEWLGRHADERGCVDFGVAAMKPLLANGAPPATLIEAENAPVLLPTHLDQWVQTSPTPEHEAEPSLFLHGSHGDSPDVQVCWRADLEGSDPETWAEIVALCPPSVGECMNVPLVQFKRWLTGEKDTAAGDIEGLDEPADAPDVDDAGKIVLVWRGDDSFPTTNPRAVRAGDTVVVPVATRGWNELGYVPSETNEHDDCAEHAMLRARRRIVVRVHAALLARFPERDARQPLERLLARARSVDESAPEPADVFDAVATALAPLRRDSMPGWQTIVAEAFRGKRAFRHFRVHDHPGGGWVVERRLPLSATAMKAFAVQDPASDFTTEDDSSSFTTAVSLKDHLAGVAEFARTFASACALPESVVSDIALAASLHDLGKADPRFQSWLRGGAPAFVAGSLEGLLAKSSGASDRRARDRARRRAGYPEGGRHELLSLKLAESSADVADRANDLDLVLHLIASHHGRCRPLAPAVDDPDGCEVVLADDARVYRHAGPTGAERIDSGVSDRFWRLVRRYGWWGLAHLEAIHVLADHRRSEYEQMRKDAADQENDDDA